MMMIVSLFKKIHRLLFGPMPLSDFADYETYWSKREADAALTPILHRYEAISRRIPVGFSVLDVGCGDGGFLKYLHARDASLRLFGVDLAKRAVDLLTISGIQGAQIKQNMRLREIVPMECVGSSRVDLQACKLEYSIVSPK